MATPSRCAALATLRAVRRGMLAGRALRRATHGLTARDRAWTRELVYGTLRLRARLDHALATVVHRPIDTLDDDVRDVLRMGGYQLLEMRSVPPYAAVSQSVELAKSTRRAAAGLVNGALQALARDPAAVVYPRFADDPVSHLTTWGSHPGWLVERWLHTFGVEAVRRLIEANNTRPALYVRPVGQTTEQALCALWDAGIDAAAVAAMPDAVRIPDGTPLEAVFAATRAIVQDPAAGLVPRFVAAPAGARIADLCAAPGGKAIALADATPGAHVFAGDISTGRVRRLRSNVNRLALRGIGVAVADARVPPIRETDVVLLDVPCTGTGVFRRRPDSRWRLRPEHLPVLCRRQAELLDCAARIVRQGGLLVYATCSIEPEENEHQVAAFLARHPGFRVEPPPSMTAPGLDGDGMLRLLPHVHGFDGAFAARLRRE